MRIDQARENQCAIHIQVTYARTGGLGSDRCALSRRRLWLDEGYPAVNYPYTDTIPGIREPEIMQDCQSFLHIIPYTMGMPLNFS